MAKHRQNSKPPRLGSRLVQLFLAGCLLASCSLTESGSSLPWQAYQPEVLVRARREGKPVLMDFYADWCAPCIQLEETTWRDPRVEEATRPFVLVKVDLTDYESPRSQEIRSQFGVTGVPEILFLDAQGEELRFIRVLGYVGPEDLLHRLRLLQLWVEERPPRNAPSP